MSSRRIAILVAAATLAVAGCGESPEPAAGDRLGTPVDDTETTLNETEVNETTVANGGLIVAEATSIDECSVPAGGFKASAYRMFDRIDSWAKLGSVEVSYREATGFDKLRWLPPSEWVHVVPSAELEVLSGEVPEDVLVRRLAASMLLLEIESGATELILGFVEGGADIVASVSDGGNVAILGNCMFSLTKSLDEFAGAQGLPAATVLEAIARNDEKVLSELKVQFEGPRTVVDWRDQDPNVRALDPEDTPPEVLERYQLIALQFAVPESWLDESAILCTRVTAALNECTVLDLEVPLEVLAYVLPTDHLEVYIKSIEDPARHQMLATIGFLPPEILSTYAGRGPVRVAIEDVPFADLDGVMSIIVGSPPAR